MADLLSACSGSFSDASKSLFPLRANGVPCAEEMRRRGGRFQVALATAAAVFVGVAASAAGGLSAEVARGGGVELALPAGWAKVQPAREGAIAEPRTLLVVGTDGVRPVDTHCQVSSYRVPATGALVVVIGWHDSIGRAGFLPLAGMKLRRGTFECFAGRGAVAQLTRRNRDFQVNVMVGDRADAETIADALEAARSFGLVPRA